MIVPLDTVQLTVGCGVTDATLKFTVAPEHHVPGAAVIVPGVEGLPLIVMVLGVLVPGVHRFVFAVTDKNPVLKVDPTFNKITLVPAPLTMLVPAGGVQV